jgi:hypothetical protein
MKSFDNGQTSLDRTRSIAFIPAMNTPQCALPAIAAADADVNFQQYTRIFLVFPNPGSCGWAAWEHWAAVPLSSAGRHVHGIHGPWLLATYMTSRDNGVKLSTQRRRT